MIDRTDLDDQITGTFEACDFDGVTRAVSGEDLRDVIRSDRRGVIVTIINKFEGARDVVAQRENVIAFVDEAHRSQEGDFGIWMRTALPNARMFAFTGTPVETSDRSTRRAFSPVLEERADGYVVLENYMDAYSIKQSIDDGATVEVLYEPRLAEWQIENADLDNLFEEAFADLDDEQREALRRDAAREEVIAKASTRIAAITADVYEVLRDKIAPVGFKAQLVAVDREACTRYAQELAQHLKPDEYAVVMSRDPKRDDESMRRWWPASVWQRMNGTEPPPEAAEDSAELDASHRLATRKIIERFKDPNDPLRLLIVNSMLLTGFDAPVEQALFLDRPLRAPHAVAGDRPDEPDLPRQRPWVGLRLLGRPSRPRRRTARVRPRGRGTGGNQHGRARGSLSRSDRGCSGTCWRAARECFAPPPNGVACPTLHRRS